MTALATGLVVERTPGSQPRELEPAKNRYDDRITLVVDLADFGLFGVCLCPGATPGPPPPLPTTTQECLDAFSIDGDIECHLDDFKVFHTTCTAT